MAEMPIATTARPASLGNSFAHLDNANNVLGRWLIWTDHLVSRLGQHERRTVKNHAAKRPHQASHDDGWPVPGLWKEQEPVQLETPHTIVPTFLFGSLSKLFVSYASASLPADNATMAARTSCCQNNDPADRAECVQARTRWGRLSRGCEQNLFGSMS